MLLGRLVEVLGLVFPRRVARLLLELGDVGGFLLAFAEIIVLALLLSLFRPII